ncbi:MAG TPA: glycosyltransferase, partial [Candidatus Saccharimonadales bacterium]|nr:glycosyltransferase [Candidatus Saccharimonadales bacterium]
MKKFLNKTPALKKAVKTTFKGVLSAQEKRRNAKYSNWIRQFDLTIEELAQQAKEADGLHYKPLISIIAPTYNTPEVFFREMVESVLAQTYSNWELLLVDDASPDEHVRQLITQYAERDARIRHLFLKKNLHISGATNEAITIAKGEFISLFDHDDVLRPDALFEIARALNKNKKLDFIYTDEDKIIEGLESRQDPFFKPNWNPDFLHSVNYITHFTTIRKKVLDKLGYEDGDYNGAQDWELFLRVTRQIPEKHIYHIPKILYNWRIHDASTAKSFSAKPYVVESQRKSIVADLKAKKYTNFSLRQDEEYPGQWHL